MPRKPAALPKLDRFELASLLGVNPITISKWEREPAGLPVHEHGNGGRPSRYDPAAAVRWVVNRERERLGPGGDPANALRERAMLDQVRRQEIEQRMRVRAGELVDKAALVREFTRYIATCKTRLEGLPTKIKNRLPHLPIHDVLVIDGLIRDALEALAAEGAGE
jgi:phage terminase Nu1 subunit (DNA packaging protein)